MSAGIWMECTHWQVLTCTLDLRQSVKHNKYKQTLCLILCCTGSQWKRSEVCLSLGALRVIRAAVFWTFWNSWMRYCERIFSCVRKNKTDQRASLYADTLDVTLPGTYFQCSQFLPPKIVFSTQFFGWLFTIPCDRVIRSDNIPLSVGEHAGAF